MKNQHLIIPILLVTISTMAQGQDTTLVDSTRDSTMLVTAPEDSVEKDILADTTVSDSLSLPQLPTESDIKKTEKINIVRHNFKYRYQVGTALGMMAFIAFILTTAQSWNPD